MLGVQKLKAPVREAEKASLAWKPWRNYAVIRAWSGLLVTAPDEPHTENTLNASK